MAPRAVLLLCVAAICLCPAVLAQGNKWFEGLRDKVPNGGNSNNNNNKGNNPTTTTTTTTPETPVRRIIGGPAIADHCMAPFNSLVALQIDANSGDRRLTYCSGTLISPDTVVTAALCVLPFVNFPPFVLTAIVGDRELLFPDRGEQKIAVQRFVIHPGFNSNTGANNLAVVKLSRAATLGDCVQPMKYQKSYAEATCYSSRSSCRVAGWGAYTVETAVNNSEPARYGDVWLMDETFTQILTSTKYASTRFPIPPNALIAEAYEGTNIATCIYDWGSMVACNDAGSYELRGVVGNANCKISSLTGSEPTPIHVTRLDLYENWLNVCVTDFNSCATAV